MKKLAQRMGGALISGWLALLFFILGASLPFSAAPVRTSSETVWSGGVSPEFKTIASCSFQDHAVRLWDMKSGTLLHTLKGHPEDVHVAVFSPDGKMLASAAKSIFTEDYSIILWDVASGKKLRVLTGCKQPVHSVAFSPNGKLLTAGTFAWSGGQTSDDNSIKIFDVASGKIVRTLSRGSSDEVHDVAFSPDGKQLAAATDGSDDIQLWDVSREKKLHTMSVSDSTYLHPDKVAVSPDGKLLASACGNQNLGIIDIWDVATGKKLHRLPDQEIFINSITFSPDSKKLASGGGTRTVQVWDVASGKLLHTMRAHKTQVTSVTFSRDGKTIASGSYDYSILKLWDVDTGKCIRTIGGRGNSGH